MPFFPTGSLPHINGNFSMSLTDLRGEVASVSLQYEDTVTDEELDAVVANVAGVSNAGLFSHQRGIKTGIAPASALALDEGESSASVKAELVFQNNALVSRSVSIPAPDAQYIEADGFTIKNTGTMATAISAIQTVLNGGAAGTGSFVFARGYIVTKSRKTQKGNIRPSFEEPALGVSPSDAPAT